MDLLQLSDGLVTDVSQFLMKDGALAISINVHGDTVGDLTGRTGYSVLGTAGGAAVYGLKSYGDITGGTVRLFRAVNGDISYWTGAAWTTVTTYTPVTAQISMTVFVDQLFVVGATTAGNFITPINIDGVTASTSTNLTSAPSAKFCEEFMDQIYFANCLVGATRYPSRLYRSSIPDITGAAITWPSTNWDQISTNNGEEITGLHKNRALQQLLIFKDSSFHSWDGTRIKDVGSVGTSNFRSVVTINFTTYFYSARDGVYGYSGVDPKLLSRGIDKWVKGIVDPTKAHAVGEAGRIYKLYVGDCLVDGKTYTNCEMRYSIMDNTWTIYSYYDDFTVYADHKTSGVTRVYAGTVGGNVHQMARSNDSVYSDDGHEISCEFMTIPLDMEQPANRKAVDRVMIYAEKPQNLQGRMRAKDCDWSTWFPVDKSVQAVNVNPRDANFLQFHFSESSTNSPLVFNGLSCSGNITSKST